jgi:predicted transcriptional regulator
MPMSQNNALLLSVKQKYANKIFSGTKTVELRKSCPKVTRGDTILVYVTSPVKALCAILKVEKVVTAKPNELWLWVRKGADVTKEEYFDYFSDSSSGCGIFFNDVQIFPSPLSLKTLKEMWPSFHPPQGFYYLPSNLYLDVLQKICEYQ